MFSGPGSNRDSNNTLGQGIELAVALDPGHVGTHIYYYGKKNLWLLMEWVSVGYWLKFIALSGVHSPPTYDT